MTNAAQFKYLIVSTICHAAILLLFIVTFNYSAPLPVFENTNQHDVISAVVLGDIPQSKLLPTEKTVTEPSQKTMVKPLPKPVAAEKPQEKIQKKVEPKNINKPEPTAIPLKIEKKKKIMEENQNKIKAQFAQELLMDIKHNQHVKQKQLKSQFEKILHEQAEKSLRQQLLNEEIKLKGTKSRAAQGEVNKYKALILQVISSYWVVPPGVDKHLSSELLVRIAPGGVVLDVQVTKSSGNVALDNSARAAVLKASPLPVPKDATAFEAFRRFILNVKPENILDNSTVLGDG